ncbi:hypothetical protein [Phyllobacterium sp. P5_D12]
MMSMKSLVIAAVVGLSGLSASGCVETTGPYYGGYSGYGGYYGTTIYDDGYYNGPRYYNNRSRYYNNRRYDGNRDDWRRRHDNSGSRDDWRRRQEARADRPDTPRPARPSRNDSRPPSQPDIYVPPVSRPGGYMGNQQR